MLLSMIAAVALALAPAEAPFRVFVSSSAKGEPSVVETIDRARAEIENRVRKEKRSLLLVPSRDEADVIVDLQAYWTREQIKTRTAIYHGFSGSHATDVQEVEEHHSLLAIVTFFGTPREMTGVQIRKNGGSAKGAARDLVKQIQAYLRENYPRERPH